MQDISIDEVDSVVGEILGAPPTADEGGGGADEAAAATRVQATLRGRNARAAQQQRQQRQQPPAADADEAAAATRVQANVRGRNARARMEQRRQPPPPPPPPGADEEAAATRVQATLRGRNARAAQRQPPPADSPARMAPAERPSRIAKPEPAAFASPARSLVPSASQPACCNSPTDSAYGAGGAAPSVGGFISDAEHEAHQAKLRKMKRDAEARRKREYEARVAQEEAYRAQMAEEEERQRMLRERREAEAKASRDEQRARFQREREYRELKRAELHQQEVVERHSRVKPLYKRREEQEAKAAAEEEERRKAVLLENRKRFVPLEFLEADVRLPDSKKSYHELKRDAIEAKRRAQAAAEERQRDDADHYGGTGGGGGGGSLPPIGKPPAQHYRGPAREKVVRELKEQRDKAKIAKMQAEERMGKARRFGKLLNDVFNKEPPRQAHSDGALLGDDSAGPSSDGATRARAARAADPTRGGSARPAAVVQKSPAAKTPSPGGGARKAGGEGVGVARPRRLDGALGGELEARSERLNQELRAKERQLVGQIKKMAVPQEDVPNGSDLEALLRPRSDLSSAYIQAIRSKVELLEELNGARAGPASPAHTA